MTARKNTKKTLQPRFARRPLPALNLEPGVVHPYLIEAHKQAREAVELIRQGHSTAAVELVSSIDSPGALRCYVAAFAAVAAGQSMLALNITDGRLRTPEDGADDAVELR